ncbi:MAG: T9SS type A sorting domain-containing protein [Bacteroidales bacterium]
MRTLTLIATLLSFFFLSQTKAQESILSASSNAFGNVGMVSYSVGQVVFHTCDGANGTITEGGQQPYEILFMEGIDPIDGVTLKCTIYPNPTTASVTLTIPHPGISHPGIPQPGILMPGASIPGIEMPGYQLRNLDGTLLQSMEITSTETRIPLDDLPPATYFLTLTGDGKALQIYKIIKK